MTYHYPPSCNYLAGMVRWMAFSVAYKHNLTLCPERSQFIQAVSGVYTAVRKSFSDSFLRSTEIQIQHSNELFLWQKKTKHVQIDKQEIKVCF